MVNNNPSKVFNDISVVGGFQIFQYALNFAYIIIIAKCFGLSSETDAFFMALTVTTALSKLLLEDSFGKLCVPLMIKAKDNILKLSEIVSQFISFIAASFSILSIIVFVFANDISRIMAPGFDEHTKIQTCCMLRIACPLILLSYMTGVFRAFLHVKGQFKRTSISDTIQKAVNIFVILSLFKFCGILSLAYGIVIASVCSLVFLIISSAKFGLKFKLVFDLRNSNTKEIISLMRPLFFGGIASQFPVWAGRIMASTLGVGNLSGFIYALRIREVLLKLIGKIAPVIIFPKLSEKIALGKTEEVHDIIRKYITANCLVFLPIIVFICANSINIIKICLQRGNFSSEDSFKVGIALVILLVGIIPYNANTFLLNALYGYKRTDKIAFTRICQSVIQGCFYLFLVPCLGFVGLPFSRSTATTTNFIFYSIQLRKTLSLRTILLNLANFKIFCMNIVMFIICFFVSNLPFFNNEEGFAFIIMRVVLSGSLGILAYIFLCKITKIKEAKIIVDIFIDKARHYNFRFIADRLQKKT